MTASRPSLGRRLLQFLCIQFLLIGVVHAALAAADAPRWWKGNLHTHTLWSDGDDFPEMVAEWYRTNGYHFLALSDHNVLSQTERWISLSSVAEKSKGEPWRGKSFTPRDAYASYLERFGPHWVETRNHPTNGQPQVRLKPFDEYRATVEEAGRFLMIQAEEITQNATNGRAIHMGAINIHEWIASQKAGTVPEVMNQVLQAVQDSAAKIGREVLVHVNHPNYKWGVTAEDLASVVREDFFEVWNGVDGDNDPGDAFHPSTDEIWDIANTLRIVAFQASPLYGLATDDSHNYLGNKIRSLPGQAWIMVRSRFLTPEHIIRAIRAGDFYASTGVALDEVQWDPESKKLSLQIQGRAGESFITRFIGTRRGVSVQGRARTDADGKVVETTLDYRTGSGPQMGEVLAEVPGLNPIYTLQGDELYVRAVVTSSGRIEWPSTEYEFQRAWTQPVGWQRPAPAKP
jgi:hypothetical protein